VEYAVTSDDTITTGVWNHVAFTYDGESLLMYYNGLPSGSFTALSGDLAPSTAALNIGQCTAASGRNFDGIIDEVRISSTARSSDWIRLNYENQRQANTLVSRPLTPGCTESFSVNTDNLQFNEGEDIVLSAAAECAYFSSWSLVQGAATVLLSGGSVGTFNVGRIVGDTSLVFRFAVDFASGTQTEDITVTVKENVPDPEFTLSASVEPWNGVDTLYVIATIDNLTDIQNSLFPDITSTWMTSGVIVNRTPRGDTLMVRNARESGTMYAEFCADNGHTVVCDSLPVTVVIQAPITVLTPNGGEELTGGSVYNVTWESVGSITQVHVQYQLDGGSWSTAAINQDNTGTYAWTVPNINSTAVLLRVVSATGGLLDEADGTFTIVAGDPSAVDAYRDHDGIVFQINGLNRIKTGGYNYQRLEVLDLNGILVKELAITGNRVIWDLESSSGSRAANGIYLVRLIGKDLTSEFKVLVE
jgi:hypothetical protein